MFKNKNIGFFFLTILCCLGVEAQQVVRDENTNFFSQFSYELKQLVEDKNVTTKYIKKTTVNSIYDTGYKYLSPFNVNLHFLKTGTKFIGLGNYSKVPGIYDLFFSDIGYPIPLNYRDEKSLSIFEHFQLIRDFESKKLIKHNEFQKLKYMTLKEQHINSRILKIQPNQFYFLPSKTTTRQLVYAFITEYNFDMNAFEIILKANEFDNTYLSRYENKNYTCFTKIEGNNDAIYHIMMPSTCLNIKLNEIEAEKLVKRYNEIDSKGFIYRRSSLVGELQSRLHEFSDDGSGVLRELKHIDIDIALSIDSIRIYDSESVVNFRPITTIDFLGKNKRNIFIFGRPIYSRITHPTNGEMLLKQTYDENMLVAFSEWNSPPTQRDINEQLDNFRHTDKSHSMEEAEVMLKFLGADSVSQFRSNNVVVGYFNLNSPVDRYAISIWPNTYNKYGVYGIRFGNTNLAYHGSNDTYFEIKSNTSAEE